MYYFLKQRKGERQCISQTMYYFLKPGPLNHPGSAVCVDGRNKPAFAQRSGVEAVPNQQGGCIMYRIFLTFLILSSVALGSSIARAQEDTPDGTVRLSAGSVAAGIGFSWGGGTLTYQGKEYP